jgi:predicted ester cyclase
MRLDCNDQMVTEPEDALRSYLAAGEARHFDEFSRVLHDGVVVHSPGGATYVGVDAQLAAWQAAHARLFLGIGPTGHRLQVCQALFARVGAGRIQELWEVVDAGDGLRQLGVLADQSLDLARPSGSDG